MWVNGEVQETEQMINTEDFFDFLNFSKLFFQDILCPKCCLVAKEHLQPTSACF